MDFNTDYILNPYAKKAMEDLKQDYNNFMDKNLLLNSVYRNLDGSIKSHNYSNFGIVSNTPGLDGSDLGFPW
jgi:hypothetical protein